MQKFFLINDIFDRSRFLVEDSLVFVRKANENNEIVSYFSSVIMKKISLVLLVLFVASVAALPLRDTPPNVRLFSRDKDAVPVSTETGIVTGKDATNQSTKKQSEKTDGGTKESSKSSLPAASSSIQDNNRAEGKPDGTRSFKRIINEARDDKTGKKNRRHKAIFLDYPLVPQLPFPNDIVPYDIDYPNNKFDTEERTVADSNNLQESNIFYIRLPPTPYMFVPGLGYISQPPTYSTANLQPLVPYKRPGRPRPAYQQSVVNHHHPFIKLPIDFVSNGKPTSVYHWQKKTNKKPTDTPITNLDTLSADFVTNGKPTAIYQWQANVKPTNKPDHDSVHKLDKGPYEFNGKPTSFFLLKPDGTAAARHPFRYSDYQDNSYY